MHTTNVDHRLVEMEMAEGVARGVAQGVAQGDLPRDICDGIQGPWIPNRQAEHLHKEVDIPEALVEGTELEVTMSPHRRIYIDDHAKSKP